MSKLKDILAFTLGAAVGSVVTWKLIKNKYETYAQEEIDSVIEEFKKHYSKSVDSAEETQKVEEVKEDADSEKEEHKTIVKDLGYVSKADDTKPIKNKDIYVIPPEIFGDCDYEIVSLTYYEDGVLAYGDGTIVENIDEVVGEDSLTHFGEFEDDSVFVRNNAHETDYEILADYRKYSELFPGKTNPVVKS